MLIHSATFTFGNGHSLYTYNQRTLSQVTPHTKSSSQMYMGRPHASYLRRLSSMKAQLSWWLSTPTMPHMVFSLVKKDTHFPWPKDAHPGRLYLRQTTLSEDAQPRCDNPSWSRPPWLTMNISPITF